MGMDSIELVMELEQTFEVEITDQEGSSIHKMGDIYQLILRKLKRPEGVEAGCLSAHTFYKLRRAMAEGLKLERAEIRPKVRLTWLLPKKNRKSMLQNLEAASGLDMPQLQRPGWMEAAVLLFALGTGGAAGVWAGNRGSLGFGILAFFVTAAGSAFLSVRATGFWKREIRHAATFGDFVRRVRDRNFSRLADSSRRFQEKEVWTTIVTLTAEILGVKPEEIRPESRLVEDLNMG